MKEKLIELLGLAKDATEDQILETVSNLKKELAAKVSNSELEKAIAAKIRESHGALNREQALEAINGQKLHDAKAKKK